MFQKTPLSVDSTAVELIEEFGPTSVVDRYLGTDLFQPLELLQSNEAVCAEPSFSSRPVGYRDRTNEEAPQRGRGLAFWLIFLSLCLILFLTAIEYFSVSTALPIIAAELHGSGFVWVGVAYPLSASAILPMTGGIAQIFGRRQAVLGSILFFALGCTVCGAATNMNMLIGGRVIQGVGGGGILSLSSIVLADLVPLAERGIYGGIFAMYAVLETVVCSK